MGSPQNLSLSERVRAAASRRAPELQARTQDAWRVVNGPADGAPPGLAIDRYGRWLVLSARESVGAPMAEAWASAAHEALGTEGVVLKTLRRSPGKSTSQVHAGTVPRHPISIREDEAVLLCELDDGVATGLYLDQHDTRRLLRRYARDVEVLNLFAYTGAFSVHAALAGARRVTSVDVARKALRRGRENMVASGLDPDAHRWFPDDVIEHVARAARRGARYGLVILDPPGFGRAGRSAFALEEELPGLIRGAAETLVQGGVLAVANHVSAIDERRFEAAVSGALSGLGRAFELLHSEGLPAWDHPVAADPGGSGDRGDYLRTLVLRIS